MDVSCDTIKHPIVKKTQAALEKRDVKPLMKWVNEEKEKEIHDLFKKTLIVRNQGKEAQDIADRYFLEYVTDRTLSERARHIPAKHRQELLNLQSLKQIII